MKKHSHATSPCPDLELLTQHPQSREAINRHIIAAFSGSPKQENINLATSSQPSRGSQHGEASNDYVTYTILRFPKQGDRQRLQTPAVLGPPKFGRQ